MKKCIAFLIVLIIVATKVSAQSGSKEMLYDKFWSAGLNITNNGFNFNYSRGLITDVHTRKFYEIEFATIHDSKEYKQTKENPFQQTNIPNPKPFVYGKQNSFYNLNISYGVYKELGRRAERAGVSVGIKFIGGISLGILKPYCLQLKYPGDNFTDTLKSERYTESNKNLFLNLNSIYGSSSFTQGLSHLKFIPGIHGKIGMHFDYAIYNEYLKAIEAGVFFNVYYKVVPIMLVKKNQQFYPGIYVGFEFGKKS